MKSLFIIFAVLMFSASTAFAQTQSTITVSGTNYTLFTGFPATGGTTTSYSNFVDGNTSTTWAAYKGTNFAGGESDPAFVEFHADVAFIPKGYILTNNTDNNNWTPTSWALKAKLTENDNWTVIHSSNTALGNSASFELTCSNDGNNLYQYFRFEIYDVGTTYWSKLNELQFYGSLPAYTHLTVKAATCTATGIKRDCYRRNSDGKYFTDETGATELTESDVIAPIIAHTGVHHEATDVNIEYWQCSMCGKYFSDEVCTTEITEKDTKIYRTITIDGSISSLVKCYVNEKLAGETVSLYVNFQIDPSTLKVNDGAVELSYEEGERYTFTVPAADVIVTAEVAQSNVDGDILTGSIRHTVTITDGASITLNNADISGSIVCEGSATITLVGTNSVSGATFMAGIQVGGSGTTLTIKGDGSLTANGGAQSAGIGLSRAWKVNATGGDILIEGGTIIANGSVNDQWGAGIGTGLISDGTATLGTITIKGGSVKATGGSEADGIGTGYTYYGCTNTIGTVTIYDGIVLVDASSISDFDNVVYKYGETDVTANKPNYFAITEEGNHKIIEPKPVIAEIADQTYTGSEITSEPQVTFRSLILTKGTDYEYSYTNNTNCGTATVRVTFKGDYASLGYVEKTFQIVPKETTLGALTLTEDQNGYSAEINGNYTGADAFSIDQDIAVSSVSFSRTFTANQYSTIILPFDVPNAANCGLFYSFDGVTHQGNAWIADVTQVTEVKANTPYLFKPSTATPDLTKDVDKLVATTPIIPENDKWDFVGMYQYKEWAADADKDYGFAGEEDGDIQIGEFVKVGAGASINPFRCYLTYKGTNNDLSKSAVELPDRIIVRVTDPDATDDDSNTEIITPVSEITAEDGIKVWSYNHTAYISAQPGMEYRIVDMGGRTIRHGVTASNREEVSLNGINGIVIVKIGNKTFKIKY